MFKKLSDKKKLNNDEYEEFLEEIGGADRLEAYDFDGSVGSARKILKDEGGAAGMEPFLDSPKIDAEAEEVQAALSSMDDVGEHEDGDYILQDDETFKTDDKILIKVIKEEIIKLFLEKKKKRKKKKKKKSSGKKDACYHKVKSRYKVWPSAYASGALVRCRKVGAKNWGNKSKK